MSSLDHFRSQSDDVLLAMHRALQHECLSELRRANRIADQALGLLPSFEGRDNASGAVTILDVNEPIMQVWNMLLGARVLEMLLKERGLEFTEIEASAKKELEQQLEREMQEIGRMTGSSY